MAKLALLGAATSILAAGVSVWVSYSSQVERSEKNLKQNIDSTLDSIHYRYQEAIMASSSVSELENLRNKTEEYYQQTKDIDLEDYDTFEEYRDAMEQLTPWYYPHPGIIGMSQDQLAIQNGYRNVASVCAQSQYSSDAISCFVAYMDSDTQSFVFLADSRSVTNSTDKDYYHVAAGHYTLKEDDLTKEADEEDGYDTYLLDGFLTRFVDVVDPDTNETVATFFIQYNHDKINQENLILLRNDLLILGSTSLAIIGAIILFSHLMFTRNARKLTKASEAITQNLSKQEEFEIVDPKVNTHDEMKMLADSFLAMERQLVDYISILKKEAVEKERSNAELAIASRIQLESLPKLSFQDSIVSLEASIVPAKEVGGDFYDYFYVGEQFVILISDVSGKGVPAALFMMRSRELIKAKLSRGMKIEQAVKEANEALAKNNQENLFVTSFVGMIDFKKEEIVYVNAGHEKPYILSDGEIIKLDGNSNFVLGGVSDFEFAAETHPFHDGDRLFLFTDGLNESINDKEEEFGYERLEESLKETKDLPLRNALEKIRGDLASFVGEQEAFDDVTMLLVKRNDAKLHLEYRKKDYSIIEEAVDSFQQAYPLLPEEVKSKVGVVLDELLNNLVSYEKREDLEIDLDFELGKSLSLIITANGDDYDFLKEHQEKYATDYKNLKEGGFGVSLVKSLTEEVHYSYQDGHSIVSMSFAIGQ